MNQPFIKSLTLLLCLFGSVLCYTQTPVSINGQLKVIGTKLCNQSGNPIQLRGMSTHGIQWYANCTPDVSLDTLAYKWGADIFRISMYVQEGGYETNPAGFTAQVKQLVDKATARGMYALIDFHMLTPGDPNYNLNNAKTFFTEIANTYKNSNNVLYEICNEPNGVTWATIKNYADQVIPVIRAIDGDAVILVGTRGWSSLGMSEGSSAQEILNNPLTFSNVMYSFHFYAKSHQDAYLNQLDWASDRLPIFVTEFGTQEASGDGTNDLTMGQRYMDLMRNKKISWTNWNYSDNPLSGAVWQTNTCSMGVWTPARLKEAGVWIRDHILNPADDFVSVPAGENIALSKTVTVSSVEDNTLTGANTVDGNSSTRWASTLGVDPQWITVDLGNNYNISRVKINWEAAYGKNFLVQVSANNSTWTTLKDVQGNTSLSNDYTGLTGVGRYIRIYGTARGTQYGYSIYELQAYGTLVASSDNIALNKSVTVSSTEATGLAGSNAVDGNATTRWASTLYVDPQWITVDLGSNYNISRVKINWEAAYAKNFLVQVSSNNSTWTTLKDVQGNTSLSNDYTGLAATGRYVRIYGTARGTEYGYSIYELEVYGTSATTVTRMATSTTNAAISQEQKVSVYPIPAEDHVTINIPNGSNKKSQVFLSDINGKVIKVETAHGNTYVLNMSKVPSGIYIVQVIQGNQKFVTRIWKK